MDFLYMIIAIIVGSAVSLAGGALLFTTKKRRDKAILLAMPFGAGALLAAAFLDLLPESFELGDPAALLVWTLGGFLTFFVLERSVSWFHHHHEHSEIKNASQRNLIILGDVMHNAIDGIAIGAAFVVSPVTGVITAIAVATHEIPKELGTFALLLSRGWKDKKVLLANVATAVATLITASLTFILGSDRHFPVAELLAITAGLFIYIAASDIIPDIHEQPRKVGLIQAGTLITGIAIVGTIITLLSVSGLHGHENHSESDEHYHPGGHSEIYE